MTVLGMTKCPGCNGTGKGNGIDGRNRKTHVVPPGEMFNTDRECPRCNGTGKVPKIKS